MANNKNPNERQRGDQYNPGNMSGKTVTHEDESEVNNKNPNEKQRGDQYNPGNMSGKTVTHEDESERSNANRMDSRHEQQDKTKSRL